MSARAGAAQQQLSGQGNELRPAERCDKRTAQDEAAFNSYRAKVEAYEIPYLQRKNAATRLDRNLLHPEPLGPLRNDPAAQRPDLNNPSTSTSLPAR